MTGRFKSWTHHCPTCHATTTKCFSTSTVWTNIDSTVMLQNCATINLLHHASVMSIQASMASMAKAKSARTDNQSELLDKVKALG